MDRDYETIAKGIEGGAYPPAPGTYPFPYFQGFTVSPPVIPDYYWDVYSQEERIKAMCMELVKLIAYCNKMADVVNDQYKMIRELHDTIEDINKRLQAMEKGTTYGELKENGFIYTTYKEG